MFEPLVAVTALNLREDGSCMMLASRLAQVGAFGISLVMEVHEILLLMPYGSLKENLNAFRVKNVVEKLDVSATASRPNRKTGVEKYQQTRDVFLVWRRLSFRC